MDMPFLKGIKQVIILSKKIQKPRQPAKRSGQYEMVGPRGGRTGEERTVTRNEPLPPTYKPGQGYVLVDPTKHKGK
jgi:hypothetical protein